MPTFPGGATFAVSLTLDVEMCTNFPYWTAVWDHRKGALDADTKGYVAQLSSRAHELGIPLQYFIVGSALEDPDLAYLLLTRDLGHAIGNHTYTHVSVKAKTVPSLQVVYKQEPWRACGREPLQVIRDEVHQSTLAFRQRLGIEPAGFRTPGGFTTGLHDVPEVQQVLTEQGFTWASSHYHLDVGADKRPPRDVVAAAVRASVEELQPYRYPGGLLEVPMMGMSDIWAFRVLDLDRADWLYACQVAIDRARELDGICSILAHPAVLACRDPFCDTVRLVAAARDQGGWIADNAAIAALYGTKGERTEQ